MRNFNKFRNSDNEFTSFIAEHLVKSNSSRCLSFSTPVRFSSLLQEFEYSLPRHKILMFGKALIPSRLLKLLFWLESSKFASTSRVVTDSHYLRPSKDVIPISDKRRVLTLRLLKF